MLIRPHDNPIDADHDERDLLAAHPFGTLIAPETNRELPVVVPIHVHVDGNDIIRLHPARPQRLARSLEARTLSRPSRARTLRRRPSRKI